ncbi:hypothetical protein TWF281_004091 [Arthrobotrys megalospora]
MPIALFIKLLKLFSALRRHGHNLHRYPTPLYLNIGFLTPQNAYKNISLPLTPTTTALDISHAVAESLHLPHEFDPRLQISLLPYGFNLNDHRLLSFISLFPKNLVHKEKFINLLAPRRPPFPSFPAKRYRGRTLQANNRILPLLRPWKQDALHVWVGLAEQDERILRYQDAVENCQLIIQEKERTNGKCQKVLKYEVAKAYNLRHRPRRMIGTAGVISGVEKSRSTTVANKKKMYRCQITDEYFTLDRLTATTIYPHTLMMELKGLNEDIVDMLTGPENALLMSSPIARMFDEGLITIERREVEYENLDYQEYEPEYGYFLKVNYNRLQDSRVFAKEDWEGREHRERIRWRDINGKKIVFSDDGKMVPYKDFLEFHAELSGIIFGGIELRETEDMVLERLTDIFSVSSADWGSASSLSTSSVFSSNAGSPPLSLTQVSTRS